VVYLIGYRRLYTRRSASSVFADGAPLSSTARLFAEATRRRTTGGLVGDLVPGMSTRRERSDAASNRRTLLFALGYLSLGLALVSPIHALGERLFSVHMVQHLLLTLVAPPLLLLSSSMPVLLWGLPASERAGLGALAGRPGPVRTLLRALTTPLVAWWLFMLTQWLWHQPAAYQWALESRWAHYAEHLSFFITAVLFWWPVIGSPPLPSPLSYPGRMLYTFCAWMPNTFLGAGLTLSSGLLYPFYAQQAGVDAYADQQLAGLLMWMPGDMLFAAVLLLLLVAFLQHEQRTAERLERELDRRSGVGPSGQDIG
jgi:putative membrane protein